MLAGRLVGMVELYVLGAAGIALTIGAVVYVRALRCQLEVARTLHPARVHAGGTSLVQLAVRNVAWRRSPTLVASDPFDGGKRVARFLVPPLGSSDSGRAAYRVPPTRTLPHRYPQVAETLLQDLSETWNSLLASPSRR